MDQSDAKETQTEFEKFEDFAKIVVAVPKREVDEQEKKYQTERKKAKRKLPRKRKPARGKAH